MNKVITDLAGKTIKRVEIEEDCGGYFIYLETTDGIKMNITPIQDNILEIDVRTNDKTLLFEKLDLGEYL